MELDLHLARTMLSLHPVESARILETLPASEAAEILTEIESAAAARVIGRMTSQSAARVADQMGPDQIRSVLPALALNTIVSILRPLDSDRRQTIVDELPEARAAEVRPLLELTEGTAGGMMDPDILVLPRDISVAEALIRVRQRPDAAREELYIIDEDRILVGSVSLSALMAAGEGAPLLSLLREAEHTIRASAGLRSILAHAGWKLVTSMPVVDANGVLLGALDHRTLRRIEDEASGKPAGPDETTEALGDLFRAALGGVLDSLVTPTRPGRTPTPDAHR